VGRFSPQPNLIIAVFQGEGKAMIELIEGEKAYKRGLFMVGMEVR
jgi:hypothetical protein